MALTFPSSPSNGQIFTDTATGYRYIYNATAGVWAFSSNNVGMSVSSTPPGNVGSGSMWYNREIGRTFVYYNDGDSSQWVETVPATGSFDGTLVSSYANTAATVALTPAYNTANAGFALANTSMVVKARESSYNLNTTTTGTSAYLKWLDGGGSPIGTPGNTAGSIDSTGQAATSAGLLLEYDALYNSAVAGKYKLQMYHNTTGGYPLWFRTQANGGWQNWNSLVHANYLGNVGIGTTSPSSNLHVIGTANVSSNLRVGANLSFDNIDSVRLWEPAANTLTFHTASTECMRIDPTGSVGIGTSTLTDKLTVAGAGKFTGQLDATTVSAAGFGVRVRAVSGDANSKIQFTNNAASADWGYFGAVSDNKLFWRARTGYETVENNSNFSINGGCVLINKLDSDGTDTSDWPTPVLALKNHDVDYHGITMITMGNKNDDLTYETGSAKWSMRLWNDAGGTWTTSNSSTALELKGPGPFRIQAGASNGVQLTNGATSWVSWSDESMKFIVEPITDALNKITDIRTVIGRYKTDDESIRRPMLIAQDVQKVLPEAVTSSVYREEVDPENPLKVLKQSEKLTLSYTETIPLLFAALKELKVELDAAKAEIEKLKGN